MRWCPAIVWNVKLPAAPTFSATNCWSAIYAGGRYDITCEVSLEDVDVRTLLRETFLPKPDREGGDRYYISGDLIRGDKVGADKIGGHKAGGDIIDVGDIQDTDGIVIGKDIDLRHG